MKQNFTSTEEMILELLPECTANCHSYVTQNELSAITGFKTRQIRYIIQTLREKGVAICSGDDGYYIALDSMDLACTIQRLSCQMITLKKTLNSLKNTYDKMMLKE